ncbi:hypothetical protein Fmac_022657 [Flemingia macrophylla]|uniref:Uncharacterized protein n=1 Tax=Flemingia macrophylla TaxID=520843 RepID=A0ABD1M0D7_9FABA
MERNTLLVCCVVAFLGLLAAATSFGAEATRIKGSQVHYVTPNQCMHPRSPALSLGLIAALALMLSQIVINVAAGCVCCRRNSHIANSSWKVALVSFVLSWFTFVIAFLLLLSGATLNDEHGQEGVYFGYYDCVIVKPGVFAGGAILSIASVAFGIEYYISLTNGKNGGQYPYPNQGVIAMAQPQIPPSSQTSQEPVFVHEDTYIRRQFT